MNPGLKRVLGDATPSPEINKLIADLVALKTKVGSIEPDELFDNAAELVRAAKVEFRRRVHAAALAASNGETDVHTEHCCVWRSCKYGYDRLTDEERVEFDLQDKHCTVMNGEKVQSYFYADEDDYGY
jgi:hypothetical protein